MWTELIRSLRTRWIAIVALMTLVWLPGAAPAAVHIVSDGELIQDAVDAASPGDTIFVKPGTYTAPPGETEYVVEVEEDDITLIGSKNAVIEASGIRYGVMVGENAPITADGCPPITVSGFRMRGFTIQNAAHTGARLVGVEDFVLSHGTYLNNDLYGPFPVCSRNGRITRNFASGHNDAAIYVGDDDRIDVTYNVAVNSVVGAEIENSTNCTVTNNFFAGNAGGLLVFVGPNLPMPFTDNVLVAHNQILFNNRTNTGSGAIAGVPEGTGILMFGVDNVTVERNNIIGNDSFGLGVIGNFNVFLDPRIEPFNDNLVVRRNEILLNGANPDPLRALTPGVDIVFIPDVIDPTTGMLLLVDPDPSDNCFDSNVFDTDFPPGVVGLFPCP